MSADAKLQSQLDALDAEIKATTRKADDAEAEAKKAATDRDRDYWRDKEKQLRDEKQQLRDKEKLLLQAKLLPTPGVLSPELCVACFTVRSAAVDFACLQTRQTVNFCFWRSETGHACSDAC
jgi:hypothetical protein